VKLAQLVLELQPVEVHVPQSLSHHLHGLRDHRWVHEHQYRRLFLVPVLQDPLRRTPEYGHQIVVVEHVLPRVLVVSRTGEAERRQWGSRTQGQKFVVPVPQDPLPEHRHRRRDREH
jgi:hypothetical protein